VYKEQAMADRGDMTQFTIIDAQADPRSFITFLDAGYTVEGMQRAKRESLSQLDLEPGHRVLDVGCGTGEDVRAVCDILRLSMNVSLTGCYRVVISQYELIIDECERGLADIIR